MKKIGIFCLGCLLGLFLISSSGDKTNIVRKPDVKSREFLIGQQRQSPKPDNRISQMKVSTDFGMLPLYFIPNQGQVDQAARFYARTSRYTLWITRQGLVFDSIRKDAGAIRATGVSRLVFVGANPNTEIVTLEDDGYRINYFTGNDPGKWRTAIPTARAVLYRGIYKNIDLKVHGIEKQVEYDWLVRPGGDAASIQFECQSIESAHVDAEGNLLVETPFGVLKNKKPFAFQNTANGSRKTTNAAFKKMAGNIWGFTVGEYDRSLELVIDPLVLVYSTYLGGSADDYDYGIAVDGAGCAYVTGQTASSDFPISDTPFQPSKSIGWDLFVTKLNSSGSGLVYSTYLGGSANDYGLGIAVDSSGCAYLTGYTASVNFPIYNPMQMFYGGGNTDAFVAKLNAGGDTLLYSTFLGGQGDERGLSIALDGSNCAYVTGYTNSVNFPVNSNPFQQTKSVGWDAFVTKLNASGSGLVYSTYLGGWSDDSGSGIAVDSSGCAYVTGQTASSNFPTQNPYQSYRAGGRDAFVSKLNASGSGLVYSTFLGGSADDYGFGIALDGSGCAYVTGQTAANDFPTHNSFQSANMGGSDAFVSKLTSGGNGLVYSTYLGGSADDGGNGIAVNSTGCAFVTGQTASGNFPTNNSFQATQGGGFDAFVSELERQRQQPGFFHLPGRILR